MSEDLSRNEAARQRQLRWEYHMHGLCMLDNHLNVEMEEASHESTTLNVLVAQANKVKDLWLELQRNSENDCVLEDTAVKMAIERHGLQSHNFQQPQSPNISILSQSSSKSLGIDCDDVFNQAVSAAIIANGLMTTDTSGSIPQDNYI